MVQFNVFPSLSPPRSYAGVVIAIGGVIGYIALAAVVCIIASVR